MGEFRNILVYLGSARLHLYFSTLSLLLHHDPPNFSLDYDNLFYRQFQSLLSLSTLMSGSIQKLTAAYTTPTPLDKSLSFYPQLPKV